MVYVARHPAGSSSASGGGSPGEAAGGVPLTMVDGVPLPLANGLAVTKLNPVVDDGTITVYSFGSVASVGIDVAEAVCDSAKPGSLVAVAQLLKRITIVASKAAGVTVFIN